MVHRGGLRGWKGSGWPLTATVEICCAVAAGVAALAAWTDGLRGELFGVTVGVRDPVRPLALAVVLLAVRWFIARRRESPSTVLAVAVPRVMAGSVLIAGVLAWIHYLSPYLGGADSYECVSAGERIRSGALVQREALAHLIPDPDAAIPLGYVRWQARPACPCSVPGPAGTDGACVARRRTRTVFRPARLGGGARGGVLLAGLPLDSRPDRGHCRPPRRCTRWCSPSRFNR